MIDCQKPTFDQSGLSLVCGLGLGLEGLKGEAELRDSLRNLAPLFLVTLFGLLLLVYRPVYLASACTSVEERGAMVLWCFSSLAVSAALCWCLWTAGSIVFDFWTDVPVAFGAAALVVLSMALSVGLWMAWRIPGIGGYLASDILLPVAGLHTLVGAIVRSQSLLEIIIVAGVCLAVIYLGWDVGKRSARELAIRIQRMRVLLYSSSALLGLAVFSLNRLLAAGVVFSKPVGGDSLVAAFSLGVGIAFAALLFLVFGPTSLQIEQRLHELAAAEAQGEDFKIEVWKTRNGLPGTPLQDLTSVGAILFPIIVGAIPG